MNQTIKAMKDKVLSGQLLTKGEAIQLIDAPLNELCNAANELRRHFCGNGFDICTIINGKSGRCSEDCKYCAQAACYHAAVESYPLKSTEEIVRQACYNDERGVLRYSIVTSGRALSDAEVDKVCDSIRAVKKETGIDVCVSLGLLNEEQYRRVKEAGASRVHNNLESSRSFFASVCTTHTYDEKLVAIKAARAAGLSVCSGGIMGLGETMEDRIDLAIAVRELGVRSIPVNMLNPIPGTPYEDNPVLTIEEMRRIVAIFRFLVPDASIRLAGGRGLMEDKGEACFCSGANATISGDMLTTAGYTIESDMAMLRRLGYEVKLWGAFEIFSVN